MTRTKDTWFWALMFTALAAFGGVQTWRNHQFRANTGTGDYSQVLDAIAATSGYQLSFTDTDLIWPENLEILGADASNAAREPGPYRLVLAVNEISCSECRDEQTAFALEIAKTLGPGSVRIVVGSQQVRYARAYMRLNKIDQEVYWDSESRFFQVNNITDSPLLLLMDDLGRVPAAHYPLPEKQMLSKPFHDYCRRLLNVPAGQAVAGGHDPS